MNRDDIIRIAQQDGLRPWVVWLVAHRLRFVLFAIWLISFPLLLLSYLPEAYSDWRYLLKAINRAQAAAIRARGQQ